MATGVETSLMDENGGLRGRGGSDVILGETKDNWLAR